MPTTTSRAPSDTALGRSRPSTSGAYLAASAAYRAGFRGWPLVIMTAIAGRESSWDPNSLNNTPATGDYSVGLWQINYFQNLGPGRTAEYGSPQFLQSSPQAQANAAYQLAGGNQLVGLQNWALTPSPQQGEVPLESSSGYSISRYMPAALSAASQVGTFGPAPASQIAQAGTWPGATPLGSALNNGGNTVPTSAFLASSTTSAGSGCAAKVGSNSAMPHNLFTFPHTSAGLTYCQAKGLLGAMALTAGGFLIVVGLITVVAGGKGGGLAGKVATTFTPVGKAASFVGRAAEK